MEGNKSKNKTKPRALLVFGAPCSGKTLFAENFANKFGIAYYNLPELEEEYGFSRDGVLVVLEQVLKTKQSIIIEGEVDTERERTEMRNLLRSYGYEPALIWVQTDMATIRLRLKKRLRSVARAKEIYENAVNGMEAPTELEKPIILSGKHTFETQTKHVVKGLAELDESK